MKTIDAVPFKAGGALSPREVACFPHEFSNIDCVAAIEVLNRFDPVFLSAPAVQGKTTTLNLLSDSLSSDRFSGYSPKIVTLATKATENPLDLISALRDLLRADTSAESFPAIIRTSAWVEKNVGEQRVSVLMLDMADSRDIEAIRWLLHQCRSFHQDSEGLLRSLRVQLLIAGSYEMDQLMLRYADVEKMPEFCLRNMSMIETSEWLRQVEATLDDDLRFHSELAQQLYEEVEGDRYFLNFLGHQSYLLHRRGGASNKEITPKDVRSVAELIRTGRKFDVRVCPALSQALTDTSELHEDLMLLVEEGSDAWTSIKPENRRELFRLGAVGSRHYGHPLGESSPLCLSGEGAKYGLRNPLVASLVRDTISSQRTLWSGEPLLGPGRVEETTLAQLHLLNRREALRKEYAGLHIAIVKGKIVDADKNRVTLAQRIVTLYGEAPSLIVYIDSDEEIAYHLTPIVPTSHEDLFEKIGSGEEGKVSELNVGENGAHRLANRSDCWPLAAVVLVAAAFVYSVVTSKQGIYAASTAILSTVGLCAVALLIRRAERSRRTSLRVALMAVSVIMAWETLYLLALLIKAVLGGFRGDV